MTYHARVTEAARSYYPTDLARSMGLVPGDHFEIDHKGESLIVINDDDTIKAGQRAVRATIKQPFTVDDFIADRRADAARD